MSSTAAINLFGPVKQFLVGRPMGRPRIDYATVEDAINDPNLTRKEGFQEKITMGQMLGPLFFLFSGAMGYIGKNSESAFLKSYMIFTATINGFLGLVSLGVGTIGKDDAAEKAKIMMKDYVEKHDAPSSGLEDVVLSQSNRDELNIVIDKTSQRGVVINARGAVGCGKTMTGKGIARDLEKKFNVKAQYWNAKEQATTEGIFDGINVNIMGVNLSGGETVGQRVERLVANAVAHHKKTGEYVVIGLDEAHNLLGKDKHSWGGFNSADPHNRSAVSDALGKLIQDKIQTEKCKGIVLVLMSNSYGADLSQHLKRRFDADLIYDRPDATQRNHLYSLVVNKEMKNQGLTELSESDLSVVCSSISDIGTLDLFSEAFDGEKSKLPDSISSTDLQEFNLLNYDGITKAVIAGISTFKAQNDKSVNNLMSILRNKLLEKQSIAKNDRKAWLDELKLKNGKRSIFD